MAIVAFCLIAILAMVRNVDAPAPKTEPVAATSQVPVQAPVQVPVKKPITGSEPTKKTQPQDRVVPATPARETPVAARKPSPRPKPSPPEPQHPQPVKTPTTAPEAIPPASTTAAANENKPLTLSFTSDHDFLHLVTNRTISVYAYDGAQFYTLTPNFRFTSSAKPRQLYELQPNTIPERLLAISPETAAGRDLQWGVLLPEDIHRQISEYARTLTSGDLHIDRHGQVNYVAQH